MSEPPTRILKCPGCGKPVPWTQSNPQRPFCSERCRLIDFGSWANEGHRISGDDTDLSSPDDPG